MKKMIRVFTLNLLAAGLMLTAAHAATTVRVTLADTAGNPDLSKSMGLGMGMHGDMAKAPMSIEVSTAQIVRGKVTFNVTNASKSMIHEMIVAPVRDENQVLPYDETANTVKEDEAHDLGEVSELDPGKSGSLTLLLKPGKYLLYCNVPGHFMAGMWTTITVK